MPEEITIPDEEKGYRGEIILDSISPVGIRLTTMRVKYPLMVHAEFCRHRCFSRSVASNRAIPTARIIAMVEQDPVEPVFWGKNQAGMAAEEELGPDWRSEAMRCWNDARNYALAQAHHMAAIGVHKQIANRILMPYQWVTEILTATDWENFFALRCHAAAQPEMRRIAEMVREAREASELVRFEYGMWHLPFIGEAGKGMPLAVAKQVSAARCARTSYRTHEGRISTIDEDLALYQRLVGGDPKHVSPTEHQATPHRGRWGPLHGWRSHRYEIAGHTKED